MREYEFVLKFRLDDPNCDPSIYVEALGENGCDDALVGIGLRGHIALNFCREASSASQAICSAIEDVKQAIPGAALTEAAPDLVNLTDLACILGFTRQNARKILIDNKSNVPSPFHEGKTPLWRLSEVLLWRKSEGKADVDPAVLEVAQFNMELNIVRGLKDIGFDRQKELASLLV